MVDKYLGNVDLATSLSTSDEAILIKSSDVKKTTLATLCDFVSATIGRPMVLQGPWNANTNVPDLTGSITNGYAWVVSVAGTTNLGGITDWQVNDMAVKTATSWIKIDTTDKVISVNGYTGAVSLTKTDLSLGNVDNTSDATKNSAVSTLTNKTFDDAVTAKQIATPSNPSSGYNKYYFKSDGKLYKLSSSGVETEVGGSGGAASSFNVNVVSHGKAIGNWVRGDLTNGNSTTSGLSEVLGVVTAVSDPDNYTVQTSGKWVATLSGTTNDALYLSDAGVIASTPGTITKQVGVKTADGMVIGIQLGIDLSESTPDTRSLCKRG